MDSKHSSASIEDKLREDLKTGLFGKPEELTLEDALQDALDATTLEEPGDLRFERKRNKQPEVEGVSFSNEEE